jgi:hypothetical protein
MSALAALVERIASGLVARRDRLPKVLTGLIDEVAKNPDGRAARLAARLLGGADRSRIPPPTTPPGTPIRVYIGPTNYAGQGFRWARALEAADDRIGARNMAIELPGGFAFPADTLVPIAVQTASPSWQAAEFEAVRGFTHVLFEAERPLFGPLFSRDVAREIAELERSGISCAFLCHGTDIRSPRAHRLLDPLSPYFDDPQAGLLQSDADANLALLRSHTLPVFVSTPDLLIDVPEASWCPVVVDVDAWAGGREVLGGEMPGREMPGREMPGREMSGRAVPVVVHLPSMGPTKGTHLIEPVLRRLDAQGVIEYRGMTGIPADRMPSVIGDADIVLDQFRIGSYGVAAVEAMAAGRIVVGHVLPTVRESVRELTGRELPVVEADPTTLERVLLDLIANPDRSRATALEGVDFVHDVHSGARSAAVLRERWISR